MLYKVLLLVALVSIFSIACSEEDNPAVIENTSPFFLPINSLTVYEGEVLNEVLAVLDEDGDSVVFEILQNPGFLSLGDSWQSSDTTFSRLIVTPEISDAGVYSAVILASDSHGGSDTLDLKLSVIEVPVPTTPSQYLPVQEDVTWIYKATFDESVYIPYSPWFEYPSGLLSSSLTHGWGLWDAGYVSFTISINGILETSESDTTWDISLDEDATMFFFFQPTLDSCRFRFEATETRATLDLIAVMQGDPPRWRIAREFARVAEEDLASTTQVSVTAGEFTCVESDVILRGDGLYVASGEYPIHLWLAAGVGVVKAVGYDKDQNELYTVELQRVLYKRRP
jgi:hypothetical protein